MSLAAACACNFKKFDVSMSTSNYYAGLFGHGYDGDCINYTSVHLKEMPASAKAARAFGVISSLCGGVLVVACFMMLCFRLPGAVRSKVDYFHLILHIAF